MTRRCNWADFAEVVLPKTDESTRGRLQMMTASDWGWGRRRSAKGRRSVSFAPQAGIPGAQA